MTEIEDSYRYYNVRTNNRRVALHEVFEELGANFVTPYTFGMIVPQTFTYLGEPEKAPAPPVVEPAPNEIIENEPANN